jgi:hypothetical protein
MKKLLRDRDALQKKLAANRSAILQLLADDYVSPKEAAFHLRMKTVQGVYDRIERGSLKVIEFDGRKYITRDQLRCLNGSVV